MSLPRAFQASANVILITTLAVSSRLLGSLLHWGALRHQRLRSLAQARIWTLDSLTPGNQHISSRPRSCNILHFTNSHSTPTPHMPRLLWAANLLGCERKAFASSKPPRVIFRLTDDHLPQSPWFPMNYSFYFPRHSEPWVTLKEPLALYTSWYSLNKAPLGDCSDIGMLIKPCCSWYPERQTVEW